MLFYYLIRLLIGGLNLGSMEEWTSSNVHKVNYSLNSYYDFQSKYPECFINIQPLSKSLNFNDTFNRDNSISISNNLGNLPEKSDIFILL